MRKRFLLPAAVIAAAGLALLAQGLWIPAKAALAQVLIERAFTRSLALGGAPVKPWPWADAHPVAKIAFERQHRAVIVLDKASGQALAFGPGHVSGTPSAGEQGTAVYAAHRDTHFSVLADVRPGDAIRVTRADGRTARFTVAGARVVRWDASGLDPHAPGRTLALSTCWPLKGVGRGPLRYIVRAELAEDTAVAVHKPDDRVLRTSLTR